MMAKESDLSYSKLMDEILNVPLLSAKGVDYRKLRDLLKVGNWHDADQETLNVIRSIAGNTKSVWLDDEVVSQLPCEDLTTIDQLWVKASGGRFGFSVQRQIWEEYGAITSARIDDWEEFCGALFACCIRGEWSIRHRADGDPAESSVGSLPYLADEYSDAAGDWEIQGLPLLLGPVDQWGGAFYGDDIVFGAFYSRIKACGL
jgi:hypothetical protein